MSDTTAADRAAHRANDYRGMLWHIATFVIINAMFWAIDLAGGEGYWAFWITIVWGVALLFHIAWYYIDVSRRGARYNRFLEDEMRAQGH